MEQTTIDRLIINSPYDEPSQHWSYNREKRTFSLDDGRRPAGYVVATAGSKAFDDPGSVRRDPARQPDPPAGEGVARGRLPGRHGRHEASSGALAEPGGFREPPVLLLPARGRRDADLAGRGAAAEKVGIEVPGDGGDFARLCAKMATGSGKTIVMAMVIAWQILNKVTYPQDARFAKNVLRGRARAHGAGAGLPSSSLHTRGTTTRPSRSCRARFWSSSGRAG